MQNILRNKKGITLVSLVVTIILLLILAGVSIRTLGGENGLITKTKIAKEENLKSEYKEKLTIAKTEAIAEKSGQDITLDEYIEQIKADKIEGIKSIEKITNDKASVITKEGYIFIITVNTIEYYDNENTLPEMNIKDANIEFAFDPNTWTNGNVEVTVSKKESKYTLQLSKDITKWTTTNKMTFEENGEIYARLIDEIGRTSDVASRKISIIDKEKPVITELTPSTNSVRIKARDNAAGIIGYAVTTTNTESTEFTECERTTELDTTVETLKQGTTYYAWLKDAAENVSESKETSTGSVTGLTISGNTNNWSTNKTITITAGNSNYSQIRYTTDGTIPTSTTGITYTVPFKITSNCTIIAVAFDSTGQPGSVTTNKITTVDATAPTVATLSAGTVNSAKNVVLTASGTDNESGIKGYEIYVNGSKVSSTNTYTITNMPFNTTYSCYTIVKDVAGNQKQSSTITVKNEAYISTVTDLKNLATAVNSGNNFSGKTITQTSDINLGCSSSNQWTPIGNSSRVFAGTYNGNNKKISNIYINNKLNYQGLFGHSTGNISNITISNGTIRGNRYIGGIVGYTTGTISNCHNYSSVSGQYWVGGIVGMSEGSINMCSNYGAITSTHVDTSLSSGALGGIAGGQWAENVSISNCFNKGNVTLNSSVTGVNVGTAAGIVGLTYGNTAYCYNTGTIYSRDIFASGIVGACRNKGWINYCYNIGSIKGNGTKCGIIGWNDHVDVTSDMTYKTYYLNTCGGSGSGESIDSATMKTKYGTNVLRGFKKDTNNINGGYPILEWQ